MGRFFTYSWQHREMLRYPDGEPVCFAYGSQFARREVRVLARQGDAALVTGLRPHERVVTVGGAAVRRASLLSSGAPEGHVH